LISNSQARGFEPIEVHKIAWSNFERPKDGPKGVGQGLPGVNHQFRVRNILET